MKYLSFCWAVVFFSLVTPSVLAQEIGYIDLTDPPFRESSRHPRTQEGGCARGESVTRQVTVTLLRLDKTGYRLGEEITFEIEIQNTGKEIISVPWTPHRADLEPADPKASYEYLIGVVLLIFKDPNDRTFSLVESLYGSQNASGTLRELSPGQSFTVRGRTTIKFLVPEWGKEELRESTPVGAKVSGFFSEDTANYSPKHGGKLTESCVPMRSTKANEWDVRLQFP